MRSRQMLLPLFVFPDILVVEAEVPFAVQVHPFVSNKLRSWIIFDIAFGCHVLPPVYGFVLISNAYTDDGRRAYPVFQVSTGTTLILLMIRFGSKTVFKS
ncbi:hypothetical protein D3C81_1713770 [compost metagenome]